MNMKPSSSATSSNDPQVLMGMGVVSGQATPAAVFFVDNSPTNFTIFNTAFPAGPSVVTRNALRVKGFTGILTVHLTFNGLLPASWTTPLQILV